MVDLRLADLPPPTHDPDDVRRLADEIMARSEFDPPRRSFIARALEWIFERIGDLLDNLFPGGAGSGGSNLVSLVVLALAVVAVALIARQVLAARGRRRLTVDEDVLEVDVDRPRSLSEWEALARRHETAGEWKDAIRCRFRALVERLIRRGVVADVAGRTSGEYRHEVRVVLPESADDFAAAAELFERAWYGDLPTGPDEASRFESHADRVLTAAGDDR